MNVLIVVDMQNDFIDGTLGTSEAVKIVPLVTEKIRKFSGIVMFTRDTHDKNYEGTQEGKLLPVPHCVRGTTGWRLHPEIEALVQTMPVDKPTFGSKDLAELLSQMNETRPITELTLVGLCTDICVISNALLLKAFLPETRITVDASCCAGVTPQRHLQALAAMEACQIRIEHGEAAK